MECVFCESTLPPIREGSWAGVVIHLRCSDCERTNKVLPVGKDEGRRYLQYLPCGHPDCSELSPNPACSTHLWEMPVKVKQVLWTLDGPWAKHEHVRRYFSDAPEPKQKKTGRRFLV